MDCNSGLVRELFLDPKHIGETTEPNFVGRSASFRCGATLRLSLNVDESQRITAARFKAAGCSVLVASASLLIDQILNKTTAEAASIAQQPELLANQLGILPADRGECPPLACEALVAAIRSYSNLVRDEWEGEEALICTCFCVSERTIEREIRRANLKSVAEVTALCNAGAGCRSCYPLIQDILDDCGRRELMVDGRGLKDDSV
jgi:NifU-like protein